MKIEITIFDFEDNYWWLMIKLYCIDWWNIYHIVYKYIVKSMETDNKISIKNDIKEL